MKPGRYEIKKGQSIFDIFRQKILSTKSQTISKGLLADAYLASGKNADSLKGYEVKYDENGNLMYEVLNNNFFGTYEGFLSSSYSEENVINSPILEGCSCPGTGCLTSCKFDGNTGCGKCICKDLELSTPENPIYKSFQCYTGQVGGGNSLIS